MRPGTGGQDRPPAWAALCDIGRSCGFSRRILRGFFSRSFLSGANFSGGNAVRYFIRHFIPRRAEETISDALISKIGLVFIEVRVIAYLVCFGYLFAES